MNAGRFEFPDSTGYEYYSPLELPDTPSLAHDQCIKNGRQVRIPSPSLPAQFGPVSTVVYTRHSSRFLPGNWMVLSNPPTFSSRFDFFVSAIHMLCLQDVFWIISSRERIVSQARKVTVSLRCENRDRVLGGIYHSASQKVLSEGSVVILCRSSGDILATFDTASFAPFRSPSCDL